MNDNRATKGPNWRLLLLIPAAVIVAKGAMRRRAMWEGAWATDPSHPYGHGHHGTRARRSAGRVQAAAEDRVDARHVARPCP